MVANDGTVLLVPFDKPVQLEGGTARVRVAEGGFITGRLKLRDAEWLKDNVARVFILWRGVTS